MNTGPRFPKRAVVTSGQPNGNKELHIGHISTFIWADTLSRFLKDAIGKENVLFVSSTDSYGSMVGEKAATLGLSETQVVEKFHAMNTGTLKKYNIGLDSFGANCIGELKTIHEAVSKEVFETLLNNGTMKKTTTLNFYDEAAGKWLNGRQVVGRCPIAACKSEEAYADECALGHQYAPAELIAPKSKLSDTKPVLKETSNYYFDLPRFREYMENVACDWKKQNRRESLTREMESFLGSPKIFANKEYREQILSIINKLNTSNYVLIENQTIVLEFAKLSDREHAVEILRQHDIRFRTGKTLPPFRITGNSEWGVPVPTNEGLTFYCWPESLWAPISNTKTAVGNDWQKFWCDKDSEIYQVIGEDNIFFYTHCAMSIFKSLEWGIQEPQIIANKHTLISGAKAASSGKKRAPTAAELLNAYTVDQIKMYFLGQNVNSTTSEFRSKHFFPETCHTNEEDPFLCYGNVLTNVFNRIVRSLFYTTQKFFSCEIPSGEASDRTIINRKNVLELFQINMLKFDINENIELLGNYFRSANQDWAIATKDACKGEGDKPALTQIIIDTIHVVRAGIQMLHCITPQKCEMIADMLGWGIDVFKWNDENLFKTINGGFKIAELPPKFDFFEKHSIEGK